jgi:hypothetical protein
MKDPITGLPVALRCLGCGTDGFDASGDELRLSEHELALSHPGNRIFSALSRLSWNESNASQVCLNAEDSCTGDLVLYWEATVGFACVGVASLVRSLLSSIGARL